MVFPYGGRVHIPYSGSATLDRSKPAEIQVMSHSFTRKELFDLVWATPVKTLATEYGLSDVGLAKTCKLHGIPLPERGHWAKKEAGKRVYQQPLPERGLGMPDSVVIGGSRWERYQSAPKNLISAELPSPPTFPVPITDIHVRLSKQIKKISVPNDLVLMHPIIRRMLDIDNVRRKKYLAETYRSSYDAPYHDSPFEQRRLRVLNTLFLSLEKNDARVSASGKNPSTFYARVGMEEVSIVIDDAKEARKSWPSSSDLVKPSATSLKATIGGDPKLTNFQTVWEDKAGDRIEKHLHEIAVNVIVCGEAQYRKSASSHHEWLVRYKAELIERAEKARIEAERAELERKALEEKARVDRLLGEAKALREAEEIRRYVQSVRSFNDASADPAPSDEIEKWASWALSQADRIDPVLSRRFLKDRD